jgi:agmatine deiminase
MNAGQPQRTVARGEGDEPHPSAAGARAPLHMPAEWEPHELTLMAWPSRAPLWGRELDRAKSDYAEVASAIAAHEPVVMFARTADVDHARAACGAGVEVAAVELDDSWIRDTGPIFVRDDNGTLHGVDFVFNGWGEKYTPYAADAELARRVLQRLGVPRRDSPLVLEGGAVTVDGQGTLITTESVLLNPNRNPDLTREDIEAQLRCLLGAEKVIWLAAGLLEDRDTDGHVDNICQFIAPGRVLAQTVPDPTNGNHERMAENLRRLHGARDARGRRLEVIELPYLPYRSGTSPPVAVPYTNFYLANGAVIVPVTGCPDDARALEIIAAAHPERRVVPVPGATLARGGGGVHCITQQKPATVPGPGRPGAL